jgi:hypothetical protein
LQQDPPNYHMPSCMRSPFGWCYVSDLRRNCSSTRRTDHATSHLAMCWNNSVPILNRHQIIAWGTSN